MDILSESETILGIDLGTTNSLVAVADVNGPRILKDGDSNLIPSVIVFDEVGQLQAVGHRAKTLKAIDPKRVVFSVKRLMGKGKLDLQKLSFQLPFDLSASTDQMLKLKIVDKVYTPIELSAAILARCKSVAENELGRSVQKAVVTVPAYFNDAERLATHLAGKIAGLEIVRILNEPTAAALAYGFGRESETKKTIAVYDFGGGTFDISILKITGEIFEVLATNGDTQLGGDDFDQALYAWLVREKLEQKPSSDAERILLLSQVQRLKEKLTDFEELDVQFQFDNRNQWTGKISRTEIEIFFKVIIERTLKACRDALKAAELEVENIDDVILVGGSSRIPAVRKAVEEFFKRSPNVSHHPEEVVALGAAIQGSILAGSAKNALLLDVVPLSLGLETMGGIVSKIIARNTTIPTAAAEMFTTYADNQTAVDLHILQGERELAKDCRSLGQFKLKLAPEPAGLAKIQITFLMDSNGILRVRALDQRSQQESRLELRPSFGLTDEQVETMLAEAWKNAEKDFSERQTIEAKSQAKSLIQAVRKSLQNPLLASDFKKLQELKIQPVLKALEEDLKSSVVVSVILTRTKELDFVSRELAEEIMNRSVSQHLSHRDLNEVNL